MRTGVINFTANCSKTWVGVAFIMQSMQLWQFAKYTALENDQLYSTRYITCHNTSLQDFNMLWNDGPATSQLASMQAARAAAMHGIHIVGPMPIIAR